MSDTRTGPDFPNLFSPLRIGGVTLKNRIVSTGHETAMADPDTAHPLQIARYPDHPVAVVAGQVRHHQAAADARALLGRAAGGLQSVDFFVGK